MNTTPPRGSCGCGPGTGRDGTNRRPTRPSRSWCWGRRGANADLRTVSQLARRLSESPDAGRCASTASSPTGPTGCRRCSRSTACAATGRSSRRARPRRSSRVASGDCIAGLATATDGAAWRAGLRPLVDDLQVFPAFVPLPQVRQDVLDERPQVRRALSPMATQLTTALLGTWNARMVSGEPGGTDRGPTLRWNCSCGPVGRCRTGHPGRECRSAARSRVTGWGVRGAMSGPRAAGAVRAGRDGREAMVDALVQPARGGHGGRPARGVRGGRPARACAVGGRRRSSRWSRSHL